MIKRRFYKLEHGDRDAPSQSSSSSSDFEPEAEQSEESEEEQEENDNEGRVAKVRDNEAACPSSSSGYESEDSSANEVNIDSSGLPTSDDDGGAQNGGDAMTSCPSGKQKVELVGVQQKAVPEDGDIPSDFADCVVKRKSVFKCKLCPRIVCLTVESLKAHLESKRHARSEKLLSEGRLKLILDDDGKLDGEADTESNSAAKILYKHPPKAKRPRRNMNTKKFKRKNGKDMIRDTSRQSAKKRRRNDS